MLRMGHCRPRTFGAKPRLRALGATNGRDLTADIAMDTDKRMRPRGRACGTPRGMAEKSCSYPCYLRNPSHSSYACGVG